MLSMFAMQKTSQSAKAQHYLYNLDFSTTSTAISSIALQFLLVTVVRCNAVAIVAQPLAADA